MIFFQNGSIRKNLTFLVFVSVLPAFAILFYTGFEHRQQTIENAKQEVAIIVRGMAEHQREVARSNRQILTTLSRLPDIRNLNVEATRKILEDQVAQNPLYSNLALVDLNGDVMTSGRGLPNSVNLADRKHFQEALSRQQFVIGEFIISRVGVTVPVFPSAIPVLGPTGNPVAVLTLVNKLRSFESYLNTREVPENSFVSATDHQGIRMYYYPEKKSTNPIGKPIIGTSWDIARDARGPGIFTNKGSDGITRFFAFEPVSLNTSEPPYLYFWSGIPEQYVIDQANEPVLKSAVLLTLALGIAILIARLVGRTVIIEPLSNLVELAGKLSKGDLEARCDTHSMVSEFNTLSEEFNEMADSLQKTNQKLSNLGLIDGLTNIANRRSFDKKLEEEWFRSQRTKRPLSLFMVDLDYFKVFNDTYGHLSGDDCLRTIGLILKNVANRSTDLPARYGGEEFAVILPETDAEGANAIAETLHTQVALREIPHKASDISRYLTVSIGIATLVDATAIDSPVELIKMADKQLYKAKEGGRNKTAAGEIKSSASGH